MRTVMCFGDSNTHGTVAMAGLRDRQRFDRATRWPGVLATALGADWHVIEEGNAARTTLHEDPIEGAHKSGLRILPALLESHRPLDLVVVMLGTNDLKARFSVTAYDIALSLERLVATIQASDCGPDGAAPQVLVVIPVPIIETGALGPMFAGGAAKSRDLAARCAERLAVPMLDAGLVAQVDPVDGIHLTAEGQGAIGQAVAAKTQEMMGG